MSEDRLEGRVAIVTGAHGGLGSQIANLLEDRGASVLRVDLHGDECLQMDVGTDAGNSEMVRLALERHGRLDILVLNAGVQHMAAIADLGEADWDRLMNVMAKGPFLAMKHAWPSLTARPGGRVVVTASGSSFRAEPFKAAYVAAKHAVLGLVKVAALEGGHFGMTVNAVAPGWMLTPMVDGQLEDQMRLHHRSRDTIIEQMVERYPGKRFVETLEVAALVAFLVTTMASGINGACIPVDLGGSAR